MADVPFPLTAETLEDLRAQVYELIRLVYEEKIGGADLGDVFSIGGEVLQLEVNSDGGLEKSSNALQMKLESDGGISAGTNGAGIKLDGTTIATGTSGTKVNTVWDFEDVVSTGWVMQNKTVDKTLDCDTATVAIVADVLATLIDDLKTKGILS